MNNQINLLKELLLKIKSETKTKEDVLKTFAEAKILTKKGNFSKQFKNLNKVFKKNANV